MDRKADAQPGAVLSVETRILGWGSERMQMALPPNPVRVADLIARKVEAEWAEQEQGLRDMVGRESEPPEAFHGLAERVASSLEEAVIAALDAYRAGWYIILLDAVPTTGLDQRLEVTAASKVDFVRVYPLPGARGR